MSVLSSKCSRVSTYGNALGVLRVVGRIGWEDKSGLRSWPPSSTKGVGPHSDKSGRESPTYILYVVPNVVESYSPTDLSSCQYDE